MALGILGLNDKETVNKYYARLRANHQNVLTCRELLKINAEAGPDKDPDHCHHMVYECIALVESML